VRGVSDENVELVRRMFEGFAESGIDGVLGGVAEEVVIEIPPELSAEPDVYRGHDGVRRYFAGFEGMIEDLQYEALGLIPSGEHVLARVRLAGRGVSSGLDTELQVVVLHKVEDGKIVYIRPYPDLDSALAAARPGA
jgi:ketosteroid isomerase-like protein